MGRQFIFSPNSFTFRMGEYAKGENIFFSFLYELPNLPSFLSPLGNNLFFLFCLPTPTNSTPCVDVNFDLTIYLKTMSLLTNDINKQCWH
jgi:hypothetical protein